MPTRGKDETLLKAWISWEDGIGYLTDAKGINGFYYANAILGLQGELRPAPGLLGANTAGVPSRTPIAFAPTGDGAKAVQYWFEDTVLDGTEVEAYLYAVTNNSPAIGTASIDSSISKLDLRNAAFGAVVTADAITNSNADAPLGSPMRYQGLWYVPGGRRVADATLTDICQLTTIAVNGGADTWTRSGAGASPTTADHLAMLNFQGTKHLKNSGSSILATNGNALLDSSWGSYNPVGDKNERALAIQNLADAMFVFNKEGLYSFNDKAQSGLVFSDFKYWRNVMREAAATPFKGGLILGHPTGLQHYTPRSLPVSIGPDARFSSLGLPPPGASTEFQNGRYHGVAIAGDFIYAIYQPTPQGGSGTGSGKGRNGLILFGTPKGLIDPTSITWQVIGNVNLYDKGLFSGCHVSTVGFPEVTDQPSPTLWLSSSNAGATAAQLLRMNLDNRATPFRARGETHLIALSGEAWMSELTFPDPVDLQQLVVYTQDMILGDEWLFGLLIDGRPVGSAVGPFSNTSEITVGNIIQSNGRNKLEMDVRGTHRVMLHIKYTFNETTGGTAAARVPPTIKRIELWGRPGAS